MEPFRVLSLDGGGSWALIQVKALMALYGANAGGHEVLGQFDLAAANSGGSIVLGCLIEDFTLQQILDFFNDENKRRSVFSPAGWFDCALHELIGIGPKYSADNKLPALQQVLVKRGNLPLPEAVADIPGAGGQRLHALIAAFDYDRNRSTFFRSQPVSGPSWGSGAKAGVTVAQAIHASTNAPVNYFDGPAVFPNQDSRYWDGAITGCNNPVLAGVTEAIGLGHAHDHIVALSLGTGSVALPWPQPADPPSLFTQTAPKADFKGDLCKMASAILDDPPDAATFVAHVMTGCGAGLDPTVSKSRVVRMNPLISPMRAPAGSSDPWRPPGDMTAAQFKYLMNLDMDAVDQAQVSAIEHFADLWLEDQVHNQPIRMKYDTLACELGQETFSAAAAVWRQISSAESPSPAAEPPALVGEPA
jgi:hypothetical protein